MSEMRRAGAATLTALSQREVALCVTPSSVTPWI